MSPTSSARLNRHAPLRLGIGLPALRAAPVGTLLMEIVTVSVRAGDALIVSGMAVFSEPVTARTDRLGDWT